jgi:hypothetical protein
LCNLKAEGLWFTPKDSGFTAFIGVYLRESAVNKPEAFDVKSRVIVVIPKLKDCF